MAYLWPVRILLLILFFFGPSVAIVGNSTAHAADSGKHRKYAEKKGQAQVNAISAPFREKAENIRSQESLGAPQVQLHHLVYCIDAGAGILLLHPALERVLRGPPPDFHNSYKQLLLFPKHFFW